MNGDATDYRASDISRIASISSALLGDNESLETKEEEVNGKGVDTIGSDDSDDDDIANDFAGNVLDDSGVTTAGEP